MYTPRASDVLSDSVIVKLYLLLREEERRGVPAEGREGTLRLSGGRSVFHVAVHVVVHILVAV
jgi:hypothetical protein